MNTLKSNKSSLTIKHLFRGISFFLLISCALCRTAALGAAPMSDAEFLDMVARDSFNFFVSEANPENGLVRDSSRGYSPCSIASVGFGLTALCVGVENRWIPKNEAYLRIEKTLRTFQDRKSVV